ncbi:MAG: hypothetical protein ACHQAX_02190 [Gammaproteobacteria bacterium]
MKNPILSAIIMLGFSVGVAYAACEDISGTPLKLVKVTAKDQCYFASPSAIVDPTTHQVNDGNLTVDDCRKIIPPDVQFYGVFFIDNNASLGISNMCEVAKK